MDDAAARDARIAAFVDWVGRRPMVPDDAGAPTRHVGHDELPWMEAGDGSALQLLHVDLAQGLWISKTRLPAGYQVPTHYHTGLVFAVTLEGAWYYRETPEAVNRPGSYLFEPAGSRHTLCTPADMPGQMVTWFAIYGANINLGPDGEVTSIVDARAALDLYRGYCNALGLDCSSLIVVGE